MADVSQHTADPLDPHTEPNGPPVELSEPNPDIVRSAWLDQARWSKTAEGLRRGLGRWRMIAAVGGVLGALLSTLAAALPNETRFEPVRAGLALAGAVLLGIVAVILRTQVSRERIQAWVRARSAAEALKEEIYRFLVGATPYGPDRSGQLFEQRRLAHKAKVSDLNLEAASVNPSQDTDRPIGILTVEEYIHDRVNGQIDGYYAIKARENAKVAKRLRNLEFILLLVAAALGVLAAGTVGAPGLSALGSWVAVLTTAGAAVTTFLAAGRYDLQAITYYGTADRLTAVRNAFLVDPNNRDQARLSKFVDDIENAISSENEAWLAGWSREEKQA